MIVPVLASRSSRDVEVEFMRQNETVSSWFAWISAYVAVGLPRKSISICSAGMIPAGGVGGIPELASTPETRALVLTLPVSTAVKESTADVLAPAVRVPDFSYGETPSSAGNMVSPGKSVLAGSGIRHLTDHSAERPLRFSKRRYSRRTTSAICVESR